MRVIRIARRNVQRQARRSNLLAGAMGFGLMVILLMNSFTAGIVESAQESLSSLMGGHVFLTGSLLSESGRTVSRIEDIQSVEEALPAIEPYIDTILRRSSTQATMIFGSRRETVTLYGVIWDEETALLRDAEVVEGSLDAAVTASDGLVMSRSTMESLGLVVNERVIAHFSTVTGQENVAEFRVLAVIDDNDATDMSAVAYVSRDTLNPVIGLRSNEYQSLSISLTDVGTMETVATQLETALADQAPVKFRAEDDGSGFGPGVAIGPGRFFGVAAEEEPWKGTRFSVATLDDYLGPLTQMVLILDAIGLGVFVVLLTIIMVGLLNTFRMILLERTGEIGTMRAIGLQRGDISRLFLWEAIFLSLRGALFGLSAAFVLGLGIPLLPISADGDLSMMLRNGRIALPFQPVFAIGVVVILIGAVVLAAWMPARRAARLAPAEALR
ncbi:MAG: FtsX-like permease family protein [Alkalispirochaeta sp.]